MTTHLFPSNDGRGADPVAIEFGGPTGRWVLHRAGIVNVWQYDRVELGFAGGRMLLRGKNGAGKSKALEILLPFLFDGDTRHLDATGRDRTTISWLMTEGRANGNHVGYVWLELRCATPQGTDAFLTLGAGLKASTATRRADSWFFLTDRRVGVDLHLDVSGECLSVERLKEAIGEEAVTSSGPEHRRRVGRHLFGLFDEARYRNLLHLLHRLRDPNIGNRVEAGELANVLTDALPPIDERVVGEAAGHFDDLDAIRDQVERSTRTAQALGQFLGIYRGYTRTVLLRRATAVERAEASRGAAARTTRRLDREVEEATTAGRQARQALDAHRRERADREAERRELERSEGYRAHQNLVDRDERVAALDAAATASESAAALADDGHGRALADLAAARADLGRSLTTAGMAADAAAGMAADAGLDPALLGPQPAPVADADPDPAELALAEERARAARALVEGRRRKASEVRQLAQEAEHAGREASSVEERAAASEAEVDADRVVVLATRDEHAAAEQAWVGAVTSWTANGLAAALDINWDPIRARLAGRDGEPTWTAAVPRAVIDVLVPSRHDARQAAAAADLAVAGAAEAVATTESHLAEVEAKPEAHPAAARCRDAARDPASGAPFYELVDIAPGVDPGAAAGVEAALEAAGLLDAWVQADGLVVHPDTHDTLLRADAPVCPVGTATLADVLVPSAAEGSPVRPGTMSSLLRAIGLGDEAGAAGWVTTGGRWSLGVLRGAWRKDT
ncbi:MAG: TIGR02680 family protein, partial [Acidimicrobiia bacterium]